jgi:DNA-binding response OmpR family regulator
MVKKRVDKILFIIQEGKLLETVNEHAEEKGKVLLIDDEIMHRKLIKTVLGINKYTFTEAENGSQALDFVKNDEFDVILIDLNMPGLSGFDTIKELKKLEKGIQTPIIMVTAQSSLKGLIEGIELGAIDYIVKPFSHDEIRAKVNAIYKFHRMRKELSSKQAELERLKLLQQTVVTLSHHINNALSSISLYIQTVDPNDPEKVKAFIKITQEQSNKIIAVVKSIEEMAKKSDITLVDYPGTTSEMLDISEIMKKYLDKKP